MESPILNYQFAIENGHIYIYIHTYIHIHIYLIFALKNVILNRYLLTSQRVAQPEFGYPHGFLGAPPFLEVSMAIGVPANHLCFHRIFGNHPASGIPPMAMGVPPDMFKS